MHSYKYGFLTTYNETVFFKQESYTFDGDMATINEYENGETKSVLWYSNPIHHDTASVTCQNSPNPSMYTDKVSVRECFLFLMQQLDSGSHLSPNRENPWTKERKGKETAGRNAKFLKFPAPSSTGKGASTSSASQSHASSSLQTQSRGGGYSTQRPAYPGQQQHYRSTDDRGYYPPTDQRQQYYSNGADPLADKMSGLHLKERSVEHASGQGRQRIPVRWDARHQEYLYTVSGSSKQKAVDKHKKTQDGDLWVKINGEKYPAISV
ncbi:MAG: hypothetical protein Q9208_007574 [Pyrenodesmia sp. 3 TL-2023]